MKLGLAIFSIIVLFGIIGVCAFGFMGMDHKNSSHMACASQKVGVDCVSQLKTFSLAVFQSNGVSAFLFTAFVLCAAFFFAFRKKMLTLQPTFFARSSEFFKSLFFPVQQELARWLALRQNSPAFL